MKNLAVLTFFSLLTILVTWPLVLHLNDLIIDSHDGLLITWFLNWDIHALSSGISGWRNFFNANIFFPYPTTLAFSEIMLPEAILALPFVLFFHEPLLAYNVIFLGGFILTGVSLFFFLQYLTKRTPAALFFSVLFTFSTIHLNYMAHLQLFNFWPVVLAIYFFLRKSYRWYVFFFLTASLTSALFLYFLLFTIAILLLQSTEKRKGIMATLIGGILTLPILVPYFLVSRQWHYVRPINDAINFSLQFPDLLNVSIYSRLSKYILQQPDTPAFLGGVFVVLVILMATMIHQCIRVKGTNFWVAVAGISFVLSLGPALHIFRNTVHLGPIPAIPLPYAVLYYLLPGFSGLRTPSRWIILTAFALCVATAIYFSKKINWRWAAVLSALVILEVNSPFPYVPIPSVAQFPPEQIWLKDNFPGAPIIQFPLYGWFDPSTDSTGSPQASSGQAVTSGLGLETLREYYSTIHWHPMFNGYSGFSPNEWETRVKWLQKEFPSPDSIKFLKETGIQLVLLPDSWDVGSFSDELKLIEKFPQTSIYQIR